MNDETQVVLRCGNCLQESSSDRVKREAANWQCPGCRSWNVPPGPVHHYCPECRHEMRIEDDRDPEGNLTQAPWLQCEACGHAESF